MPEIRGLTVCVGRYYADLLRITLPRNMRHMSSCYVVTSPEDEDTKAVARSVPGVHVFETDGFTRHGAIFNKGLCIEECISFMGRNGWILIWDSDCLFPDSIPFDQFRPDCLNGARRRILENPADWRPDLDWSALPLSRDGGPIGFFQAAHADDPAIRDTRPWYDVSFAHAGGGDARFLFLWPASKRVVLPFDVLHLGPKDTHWWGTSPEAVDIMARFVTENGWRHAARKFSPEQVDRAPDYVERVSVPGYEPSTFQLPFTRRANRDRLRRGR